ncbi:hypothetical protein OQX61_07435 [Pedobacter sp. PLR]|uniref:hypothetical protein n=1 Tax=Pedobacter sp. PLR TaxID=2994465 RepID=UPI0022486FA8|nr:hypothetical protein [Pedobacter sp. PLR]MCX2451102.1 hypothetical protein [Pedobacter sp. PLR]
MKRSLLVLSVISLLTIVSCSKNNNDLIPEGSKECVLKSAEYSSLSNGVPTNGKLNYTYDQNQRISTIKGNLNSSLISEKMTYDQAKILIYGEHVTSWGQKYEYNEEFNLDAQGRIASMPDLYYNTMVFCKYNEAGFLAEVKKVYTDPFWKTEITNTQTFSYTNGNLIKLVNETNDSYYPDKVNSWISNITYTPDELKNDIVSYKLYEFIFREEANLSHLTAFLGKRSKNLPAKMETTSAYWSSAHTTTTETTIRRFIYQKDDNGNALSIKIVEFPTPPPSDTLNEEYKFVYTCN